MYHVVYVRDINIYEYICGLCVRYQVICLSMAYVWDTGYKGIYLYGLCVGYQGICVGGCGELGYFLCMLCIFSYSSMFLRYKLFVYVMCVLKIIQFYVLIL